MEPRTFEKKYMSRFNAQQRKAVHQVDGSVLLLAVPGSGKTTVLVTRLGYMALCCGIKPEEILTVTYTVAATGDMRARCAAHFGEDLAKRFEFRTINGICAKIIQYYGRQYGRSPFALASDDKQTTALLSAVYQEVQRELPDRKRPQKCTNTDHLYQKYDADGRRTCAAWRRACRRDQHRGDLSKILPRDARESVDGL